MIWIKFGILLTGFLYAGLLPYTIKKALQHVIFDLSKQTLSFFSNKHLYSEKYNKGYKRLLFLSAILTYCFFWLLSQFYDLGEHEQFMKYIDYSFAILTLLAFVPHNMFPYNIKNPVTSLQRFVHNLLALNVFLLLPALIITFQVAIMQELRFLGISGLLIIVGVLLTTIFSVIKNGINGVTEILFINGISIWSIYVTILTFIK
ncbi:MAG: hypothetical protein AB2L24_15130 [Mangrovibacterium sp.]|jgi:hypothetical protein